MLEDFDYEHEDELAIMKIDQYLCIENKDIYLKGNYWSPEFEYV